MLFEHGRNATFYSKLRCQKGVVDNIKMKWRFVSFRLCPEERFYKEKRLNIHKQRYRKILKDNEGIQFSSLGLKFGLLFLLCVSVSFLPFMYKIKNPLVKTFDAIFYQRISNYIFIYLQHEFFPFPYFCAKGTEGCYGVDVDELINFPYRRFCCTVCPSAFVWKKQFLFRH